MSQAKRSITSWGEIDLVSSESPPNNWYLLWGRGVGWHLGESFSLRCHELSHMPMSLQERIFVRLIPA